MTHWKRLLAVGLLVPGLAVAQQSTTPTATLEPAPTAGVSLSDAISSALANNPEYQQWLNNESPANMAVKSAYATFIPSASISGGFNYTGSGSSNFGGTNVVKTSSSVGSNYSIDLGWNLNGRVLYGPAQSRANLRATKEQIAAANIQLRAAVNTQYLNVLQTNARIDVVTQQVARNKVFLELAKARYQVGQATMLDVRQAEVTLGQSEVDQLVARQQNADARLQLYQLMGVTPPDGFETTVLTDSFPVVAPTYSLDSLLNTAALVNPNILAAEASAQVSKFNLSVVKSEYFPTLRASAGWNGYTQQYTGQDTLQTFPWDFTTQPFQVFAGLSLPIFDGLQRETRVSQAKATRDDATEQVRAQSLLVRSQVTSRYLAISAAYQAIAVAEANKIAAADQLRLAQDRYRLGQGTALELSDSEGAVQRADGTYVDAIYGYHKAVVALQEAVGQPFR
ncbi:MAG: TolC family protein [Gemmatimonadales bacterium]|jgi:outer membrane protein|nr:MAG: TolC family protein [Gemmatimonadales bacterium]